VPRTLGQAVGFLLGFWIAICLSPLEVAIARAEPAEPPAACCDALEAELHRAVLEIRAARELVALARRPELDAVARAHSADMARRGYLSHTSPEGEDPPARLARAGFEGFTLAAENLARTDQADPVQAIAQGWLASPDHRRNLWSPPFNATGIGIARAPDGTLVATQLYLSYPRE
jgi:uncharacterized protein YkwD